MDRIGYNGNGVFKMTMDPRRIGDEHVYLVHEALIRSINNLSINDYQKTVKETVRYIINLYPNIKSVTSKFDAKNTNLAKDLILYLDDGTKKNVNLFLINRNGRIQTKNLGAKSFFSKYFLSESMQEVFNREFEKYYLRFLKSIVHIKERSVQECDKSTLRKKIANHFPKFTDNINQYRNVFLYGLRETAFKILKAYYNDKSEGFINAYHTLFMTKDTTIITRYGKYESSVSVEKFSPTSPYYRAMEIYKRGENSVGIKFGEYALTLRFKFESGPTSSIKLAASYETFPSEAENEAVNKRTIRKMSLLLKDHQYQHGSNQSNAIGKCHEAITYYYFLRYFPDVSQVEPSECASLMSKYYNIVKPDVLDDLFHSTSTIVPVIREKLNEKYYNYKITSIELVPDSYIEDKLDTGDLMLILRVDQEYEVVNISLKKLAAKSKKLTTKNPGIGTILGSTYFAIGDLTPIAKSVKERFQRGELDHRKSLEVLAEELGTALENSSQENLKRGIENLLGKAMMAITFYKDNSSVCKEHSKITSTIDVKVQVPSTIQNTLTWDNNMEAISLRMKFSRAQKYGWSTVKLTSEYSIKV